MATRWRKRHFPDRDQPIDGEPPQVGIADARKVGGRDACSIMRGAHGEVFPVEDLDDFGGQDGLALLRVRVLVPEVAEHIATSPHQLQFFAFHRNVSFNLSDP
jgi:hypothetical protein